MRGLLFFGFFLVFPGFMLAQSLYFLELGSEHAWCRTSPNQSGNGIAYAFAGGGAQPLTYEWKNLSTGDIISNNTTVGGLNAGAYQITVTDSLMNILIGAVEVDSVTPLHYFDTTSTGLIPLESELIGLVGSSMTLENMMGFFFAPFSTANSDVILINQNGNNEWNYRTNAYSYEYVFAQVGIYHITFTTETANGCRDTAQYKISIVASEEFMGPPDGPFVMISNDFFGNMIVMNLSDKDVNFYLYDIAGKLLTRQTLAPGSKEISAAYSRGVLVYSAIDSMTGQLLQSGKMQR